METLQVPQGTFELQRFPARKDEKLRAWDAADEYLLNHLAEDEGLPVNPRVAILNDSFGALGVALSAWQPSLISDSWLSHQGTLANLASNAIDPNHVTLCTPLHSLETTLDIVLIKVPKTLALLEDQLCRLRPLIHQDTRVIAAGMVKHLPATVTDLFEKRLGPTTTSLAKKKARLIFSTTSPTTMAQTNPYPSQYRLEGTDYQLSNHANVFCRDKLDIGTRLFIEHIPASDKPLSIIDLGCGNGVVGLIAAERNHNARLSFTDESFMAVASAEINLRQNLGPQREADFITGNCLDGFKTDSADLILNNPPFHQQQVVGDHIAWQMFKGSLRTLRSGGELWVIGNRHLGYHIKLKKLFGNCDTVASNRKFVILKAIKE